MSLNDAVSKAEVLETYAELYDVFDDYKEIKNELHKVYDKLNALPSTQPEQRWFPVSERLPEEKGRYLVSGGVKGNRQIWICDFVMIANVHGWINDASNPMVTAWMPLPEPYKEKG